MAEVLEHPQPALDESLELDDDRLYELVDGELVEKVMGAISMEVGLVVCIILRTYCTNHDLGRVLMEATFKCFNNGPENFRRPDVAFIAKSRLAVLPKGHISVSPDLVVEVVSPNDVFYNVDRKVDEYLAAGVRQVWLVSPQNRYVRIYRNGGTTTELRGDSEISGEEIIPGFSCKVSEFFKTI